MTDKPGMHGSQFNDTTLEHRALRDDLELHLEKLRIEYIFNDDKLSPEVKEAIIEREYPHMLEELQSHLRKQAEYENDWQHGKEQRLQADHAYLTRWAL